MASSKPERQNTFNNRLDAKEGAVIGRALWGISLRIGYERSSSCYDIPNEGRHALLRSLAGGVHHADVPPTWLVPVFYARMVNDGSDRRGDGLRTDGQRI